MGGYLEQGEPRRILILLILLSIFDSFATSTFGSSASVQKRSKMDRDINAIGHRDIAYKGNLFSLDKERQAAAEFSAAFERAYPLLGDAMVGRYLQHLAEKLAQNSDAKMPITVRVVDSADVCAATRPGGYQ